MPLLSLFQVKYFSALSSQTIHEKNLPSNEGTAIYACMDCAKQFRRNLDLTTNKNTNHGITQFKYEYYGKHYIIKVRF